MRILRRSSVSSLIAFSMFLAACDSPAGAGERACGGVLELDLGEAADLPEGEDCDLGRVAGAEYALAYVDGRAIALAETGQEPYRFNNERYSVTVTDLLSGGARTSRVPLPTRPDPPVHRDAPDWTIFPSDGPRTYSGATGGEDGWTVGEAITVLDPCAPGSGCGERPTRAATVVRVYDGWLTVAAVQGEVSAELAGMLELLDQALPLVRQHALPLLRSAYTDGRMAVSRPGGAQLLVLLEGDHSTFAGRAFSWLEENAAVSWISLEPFAGVELAALASLLTHEIAHAFQFAHMAATRPAGEQQVPTGTGLWGVEGGANFISYEFIRRAGGMPLAGNYDFHNPASDFLAQYYAWRAQPGLGELTAGYDHAMGFLRDLVIRRVQRGESVDAAVREVSRGAIEGWFGVDQVGSRRTGLTARMRDRIGGWEARDALLTWALSHAGDDLTDNPLYQDRASLRVWNSAEVDYGWFPKAVLQGGEGSVTGETLFGSPGYFLLRDTGAGVSVRLTASVPGVQWRVLRIR